MTTDKLTLEEVEGLAHVLPCRYCNCHQMTKRLAKQLADVMRENQGLRNGLNCIEGACMWAFDLGSREYYPSAYLPENRANEYAHHLNQARYYALKALFPEAEKGDFENLLTRGDPFREKVSGS